MVGRALAVVLTLLASPLPAPAHPAPFSYLDVIIRDDGIDGILVLHVVDVAHELGIPEDQLLQPGVAARERDRVVALVSSRFTLRADGQALMPRWQQMEAAPDRHAVQLRFRMPGPRPGAIGVQTAMFPYDPIHQTFVNVYEDDELRQQMIFSRGSSERVYYTGTHAGRARGDADVHPVGHPPHHDRP